MWNYVDYSMYLQLVPESSYLCLPGLDLPGLLGVCCHHPSPSEHHTFPQIPWPHRSETGACSDLSSLCLRSLPAHGSGTCCGELGDIHSNCFSTSCTLPWSFPLLTWGLQPGPQTPQPSLSPIFALLQRCHSGEMGQRQGGVGNKNTLVKSLHTVWSPNSFPPKSSDELL